MKPIAFAVFALLYTGCFTKIKGQGNDLTFLNGQTQVDIPFEYENNFIIIKVMFNDIFPLKFIFDTGAENTILTKREITDLFQIDYQKRFTIYGSDLSQTLYAYLVRGISFRIGDMRATLPGGSELQPLSGTIRSDGQALTFDAIKGRIGNGELAANLDMRPGANGIALNASMQLSGVDGSALRCRVVGEGGNLGLTQLGRIEAALNGTMLDTDFIDNSAGVDTSDHEVNIKILLNDAVTRGQLSMDQRNQLLAQMTDEVAALVLRDNYLQNQAISVMERMSLQRLGAKQHFIRMLEQQGLLDRQLEFLPSDAEFAERKARGIGLTLRGPRSHGRTGTSRRR